jgi:hypothetical protein
LKFCRFEDEKRCKSDIKAWFATAGITFDEERIDLKGF